MKKIILCSLVAMMAVTAANAEIASVDYVDGLVDGLVADKDTMVTQDNSNELVPTVKRVENMINDSQTDLIAEVGDLTTAVGENAQAIADEATARANADTALDTAYKAADKAISDTIGNVTEGKTVVEMITEAQSAATYDDTAVRGLISDEATARENADTTLDGKISDLETALSADGATGKAIAAAQAAADAAAEVAGNAQVKSTALSVGGAEGAWVDLTKVTGYSATGTHSLVLKDGNIQWEAIRY